MEARPRVRTLVRSTLVPLVGPTPDYFELLNRHWVTWMEHKYWVFLVDKHWFIWMAQHRKVRMD